MTKEDSDTSKIPKKWRIFEILLLLWTLIEYVYRGNNRGPQGVVTVSIPFPPPGDPED